MKWPWTKSGPDIQFSDITRRAYTMHPVQLAKSVKTLNHKIQMEKYGQHKFVLCPGMIDLAKYGYIIPAWDEINIMANKAGNVTVVGSDKTRGLFAPAKPMDPKVVEGTFEPENIPLTVVHVGSPWAVMVNNKSLSALVLPATYHSPFLDDLYVYPGIVDYGKFSTLNFIFSPKRACTVKIPAGTPLLQVIPFEGKTISAGYGPASQEDVDRAGSLIASSKQFYRKYIQVPKSSTLQVLDDSSTSTT